MSKSSGTKFQGPVQELGREIESRMRRQFLELLFNDRASYVSNRYYSDQLNHSQTLKRPKVILGLTQVRTTEPPPHDSSSGGDSSLSPLIQPQCQFQVQFLHHPPPQSHAGVANVNTRSFEFEFEFIMTM